MGYRLTFSPVNLDTPIARLTSEPDYSADVHFGKARYDGSRMPARPFMDAAIYETDFDDAVSSASGSTLHELLRDVVVQAGDALHKNIKQNILDERWGWDRITIRSTGEVASSPRDIYDTGNLYRGQKLEIL